MDTEEFVAELERLAPSEESFNQFHVEETFIKSFRKRFYCIRKPRPNVKIHSTDIVLSLLQAYDCSNIEIGAITFLSEPIEEVNFFQIGNIEADLLVINKITYQVEVLDYTNFNHVIWPVAQNGSKFLDTLLASAKYLVSKLYTVSVEDELSVILSNVIYCSELAGGPEYDGFYKILFGYYQ